MRWSVLLLLAAGCEPAKGDSAECAGEAYVGAITFSGATAAADAAAFCEDHGSADAVRVEGTDWTDLAPLSCLCSIGSLSLVDNAALTTTEPVRVEPADLDAVEVTGSPLLVDLAAYREVLGFGTLRLAQLDLVGLDDLAAATHLDDVRIQLVPSLESLDGLAADVRVGELVVEAAPKLAAAGDWAPPRSLEGLTLAGTAISSLAGLQDTTTLLRLSLVDNPDFTSLTDFPRTTTSPVALSIGDAPALDSLATLGGVGLLDHLTLQSLAPGATLAGLGSLTQVGGLNVSGFPALDTLDGLDGLRFVTASGIHIEAGDGGATLGDLTALAELESVVGGVTISGPVPDRACLALWEALRDVLDSADFACGTFEPE